ncbi:ABC transporter substrate-binding protein [Nocardioides jishulii]|uniref:Putative aliphatic sulfonates-binding protein n=1 Tax=Nocardioides jishulii TaxID=2575440 RepID=A0A4U2YV03_9ACTN|nr:ABC transporter substrate-binding protein [Nocardioides jishulii]QCX28312.1 ABC transporter substrate-binding protein [Nocardioides jishulii]TKI64795.1 ABC transporter substrate-binding protein [Nocardioides jishulii]
MRLHARRSTRRSSRRAAAAVLATLLATSALVACSAEGDDDGPVLRVGVQKDGIRSVLTASGQLDDLPYEIEWSEFAAGPPIIEAAAADQIDVAWVGAAPPIFGAASGADFKIVAAVSEQDKKQDSILVPKGSDVSSVKELKGKKVAVAKGTSGHGHLLMALEANGLSLDDIEPQYLAPADGQAAFQSGAVDAWAIWDPFVTQAVMENDAVDLTVDQPETDPYLQFEIASGAALEDDETRDQISDFLERVREAFLWAQDHPEEFGKGWAKESGLPEEVLVEVANKKLTDVGPVRGEHVELIQTLADKFTDSGEIPEKVDIAAIVEPGLIE